MAYVYKLNPVDLVKDECDALYVKNYPEVVDAVREKINRGKLKYYINCIDLSTGKIIGAMGIISHKDFIPRKYDVEPEEERLFSYWHLVVDGDHTGQGLANGLIMMALKFLIKDLNAVFIRESQRGIKIKTRLFEEVGFEKLVEDEKSGYKIFELDTKKANMKRLNELWSKWS